MSIVETIQFILEHPLALIVIAVVAIAIAIFLLRAPRGRDEEPVGDIFESAGAKGLKVDTQFFMFRADPPVNSREVSEAFDRYSRVMVGFNDGNIDTKALELARSRGADLFIYVEGPGGETAGKWDAGELERVRSAAQKLGIDTKDPRWLQHWNAGPWKTYTIGQLKAYAKQGFKAAEIDNLENAAGIGEAPEALIAFYKEYAVLEASGQVPKLSMKNVGVERMKRVIHAIETQELRRSMFSNFHIAEEGVPRRDEVERLSASIGLRTLRSNHTDDYKAFGPFGLEQQLAEVLSKESKPDQPAVMVS